MSPKKTKASKTATPKSAKKQKVVKPAPVEESSDDSSDDSSEGETVAVPVTAKSKKQKTAKPVAKKEESSDDNSSGDSDSEEEAPPVTAKAKKQKATKPVAKKEESSDDDSSDDDDSEDEAKPAAKAPKATKAPAKTEESSDDSDSDDEEEGKMEVDDDEDSSSDEEEAPAKKVNGKTNGVHKEEESDDDSEDEEDSDEEEEEAPVEVGKKRKGKQEKDVSPKKAKIEEKATLYIGNLPEDFAEEKLQKFFKKKGVMLEEVRKLGKKPFAYADLEDASQLDVALELNGCEFKGNELKIEKATPKGQKQEKTPQKGNEFQQKGRGGDRDSNTLFVKNLPFSVTEDQMREVFENATSIRLPIRPDGSPKGFGFVEFSSEAEADSAMKDYQGTEIEGRSIFMDYMGAKSKNMPADGKKPSSFGSSGDTNVLFVKNLSYDSTPESLKEAFEGSTSARIATFQDTGKSRGFGFIEFASPEDAKKAHAAMQGANVDGRDLLVDFGGNKREGGGGGGFRGGRGGGGFRGGRGGGGRGGGGFRGGRGGFRGGRGGGRGGAHIAKNKGSIQEFKGTKKSFD